jgi:hypothetical protein
MKNEKKPGEKFSPVNKGHFFDLEPPERVAAFYAKLARGWEAEYKEYRRLWDELPKTQKLTDYPLLVDLETVSRCNLKCPMCPTVTDEFVEKRVTPFKKGQLDYDIIKKVIAEVAGKIYSLRLSWIGEPTLHPRLVDAVRLAKESGIKEVSFLTNGSVLSSTISSILPMPALTLSPSRLMVWARLITRSESRLSSKRP